MEVTITAHSWIGESLRNYLEGIGFGIHSHVVDPGGDGNDYISVIMPGGWTKSILRQRIMNCDIPQSMFKID